MDQRPFALGLLVAALLVAVLETGAASAGSAPAEAGAPGRRQEARRTVEVVMRDNAFEPASIQVRAGETVRFVVGNRGEVVHEFNIGTPAMHEAHRREMQQMMEHGMLTATGMNRNAVHGSHSEMAHDDPNSVLLEPGKSGEIIWRFPRGGTLEFACNVPGHSESGMVGRISFAR
ncbi:cupredoxin family protein [Siccirubricoccus sp. KC 17139]|uniref:Cupredoxin family protein n=1 Tax=Siccirubricoccus soli TaxID=2899147 RepID=A0ABT1D2N4_9PROT|nr:cupredoxin family protein [Siccirubricoccus soli]MCO6416197.1 cupredoxin family protein [Siccirubricoccus soli]MCP2682331.1 cupredoxin family protein [Siccirubricoccus soli]